MGLRLAHRATSLVAFLGLGLIACGVLAQDTRQPEPVQGPFALHWVRLPGAGDCIAGDALARDVETKLGRKVFPASGDAQVLIEGHAERRPDGYRAELRMTDSKGASIGSRAISSAQPNCVELSETLSVVLAVMIDPDAETRARKPDTLKPPPPAAKPPPPDPNAGVNHVVAFIRLTLGVVPQHAMLGAGAAYERKLGRAGGLRVEAAYAEGDFSPKPPVTRAPDANTNLQLAYGSLAYCPLWLSLARLRLAGCAGIQLGSLRATGRNFGHDNSPRSFWVGGSGALRIALRLVAALELHLGASLLATKRQHYRALVPPAEYVSAGNSGPVGGAFDFGLGARF